MSSTLCIFSNIPVSRNTSGSSAVVHSENSSANRSSGVRRSRKLSTDSRTTFAVMLVSATKSRPQGLKGHGFYRVRCPDCGHERLLGLSCAGRLCPSCWKRRMADGAAHLVDRVLPC